MELHIQKKYFDDIVKWEKIFEWRLAKDKYRLTSIGSEIIFKTTWTEDIIKKHISSIHIYKSFEDAGKDLWVNNITPGIKNLSDMVNIYREFYSEVDENKYWIVMIWLS